MLIVSRRHRRCDCRPELPARQQNLAARRRSRQARSTVTRGSQACTLVQRLHIAMIMGRTTRTTTASRIVAPQRGMGRLVAAGSRAPTCWSGWR